MRTAIGKHRQWSPRQEAKWLQASLSILAILKWPAAGSTNPPKKRAALMCCIITPQPVGSCHLRPCRSMTGVGRCAMNLIRSEEHTSELQSLMRNSYAVLCLKKKTKKSLYRNSHNKHAKNTR